MTEPFFEKFSVSFKLGTGELIQKYVDKYPDLWENKSHFIRCALEREFRRLRAEGKFGGAE